LGVPGKVVKGVTPEQIQWIEANAKSYTDLAQRYLTGEQR
jgi:carbonic anhydrase/acetyltransferase-like protein (isoleucine patch superfamily)